MTENGLVDDNVLDKLKKFGNEDSIYKGIQKLKNKFKSPKKPTINTKSYVGPIPPVITNKSSSVKPIQTFKSAESIPVSQRTNQQIPSKQSIDLPGDPFLGQQFSGIKPSGLKLKSQSPSTLKMIQPSDITGLKMAVQQPLPSQIDTPARQPDITSKARQLTPKGLAASRWSKKYVPRGKVGSYNLEETVSKDQLKSLVKEVAKVLEKLQ